MDQRAIVVTGGERGIGRGIVERFVRDGCAVFVLGLDDEKGALLEQALANVRWRHCDVSVERNVEESMAWVLESAGGIDALVCNAGIASPRRAPLQELSLDDWTRVLSVNLTGPFLCAKHACVGLQRRRGSVVMIASTRARMSEPNTFAYSASKGGLVALTHALATSLGPEVRVNSVSPGWIHVGEGEELSASDHSQHLVGRVGTPKDVADLVAYLAGEVSGFVTGQDFVVDGGMTRKMIYED
ncbi:SDR family oxidoreductase [Pelagicoccus sp. SDUM812003]|uniref:SDR family oxidoreductase n=1 Tax=Pelagicoccus sp. SDUM812003 TaxID=3041267 RepID=UPI00280DB4DA|nr:SDR family oxidoreductase [Pelagicoccus sp. SDUM812003]MDQ8202675.1 SDR family oxidoreductase [Pelagicoccus sp. SDUM812003]